MLPGLDTRTGALPLGRFGATLDQIKRDFVDADYFSASSTRKQIWQDFWSATAGLGSLRQPTSGPGSRRRTFRNPFGNWCRKMQELVTFVEQVGPRGWRVKPQVVVHQGLPGGRLGAPRERA